MSRAAPPPFPLVGAAIGAAVGGTAEGLVHVLPPLAAAGIALAVGAALTGALHLDALADTADALDRRRGSGRLRSCATTRSAPTAPPRSALDLIVKAAALAGLAAHRRALWPGRSPPRHWPERRRSRSPRHCQPFATTARAHPLRQRVSRPGASSPCCSPSRLQSPPARLHGLELAGIAAAATVALGAFFIALARRRHRRHARRGGRARRDDRARRGRGTHCEPMSDPTRLLLVRHAEPSAETRTGVYGRLDVALSPEGEEHAERLARLLATTPITAVYASPLRRAVATAGPLAAAHGLDHDGRERPARDRLRRSRRRAAQRGRRPAFPSTAPLDGCPVVGRLPRRRERCRASRARAPRRARRSSTVMRARRSLSSPTPS